MTCDEQILQCFCILKPCELLKRSKQDFLNRYEIMATYCSYSRFDVGHFWVRGVGSYTLPFSSKDEHFSKLLEKYIYGCVLQKLDVESIGGHCDLYEANVLLRIRNDTQS